MFLIHTCVYTQKKKKKKSEKKLSLCKGQKWIDKEPVLIIKPYMKAFLQEKKDIPNYCFFFPYVPHVHISVQKRKKNPFLIACGIQDQKYLFIR